VHISPVAEGGRHLVTNGLLLRADVRALFDRGYVTNTPHYEFWASRRLREDGASRRHNLTRASRPEGKPGFDSGAAGTAQLAAFRSRPKGTNRFPR